MLSVKALGCQLSSGESGPVLVLVCFRLILPRSDLFSATEAVTSYSVRSAEASNNDPVLTG